MALASINRFELQRNSWGGEIPDDLTVDELFKLLFSVRSMLGNTRDPSVVMHVFNLVCGTSNYAPSVYECFVLVKQYIQGIQISEKQKETKAGKAFMNAFI